LTRAGYCRYIFEKGKRRAFATPPMRISLALVDPLTKLAVELTSCGKGSKPHIDRNNIRDLPGIVREHFDGSGL
jgi:hypothetical protein